MPEKVNEINLPVKYSSLSIEERRAIRNEYYRRQHGICMYCGGYLGKEPPQWIKDKKINWLLFPDNFLKYPVHLQHNHETDMTEGAVHAYCNAVMWQYEGR